MNRVKVHVGVVFTQAMCCDESGKIYYHKVLTDVDKPWSSVIEAVSELKQEIPEGKAPWNDPSYVLDIQINFTNVHHSTESIREQLTVPMHKTDGLMFHFEEGMDFKAFYGKGETDCLSHESSSEILYLMENHMQFHENAIIDCEIKDLKEYFHQQLAQLYEEEWYPMSSWDDTLLMEVNTS